MGENAAGDWDGEGGSVSERPVAIKRRILLGRTYLCGGGGVVSLAEWRERGGCLGGLAVDA